MKCFYHNDMDGKCAGAIVYKYFKRDRDFTKEMGEECQFIPIDYKDEFPINSIKPNETIVIVDFSLQKEGQFEELLKVTDKVIWIDHHKTSIERHGDLDVRGIRQDGKAGCVLTWEWFYPRETIPATVNLLGDYDIWAFKYGDDTNHLQAGIKLWQNHPVHPIWEDWLDNNYFPTDVVEAGKVAIKYRDNYYADLINSHSFFAEFEGYRVIACNAGLVSSQLFDSVYEDYDLMMPFYFDGKKWTISIYTKKDIDCSEIAKKYGGGGHKKAAGFQYKELPFGNSKKGRGE